MFAISKVNLVICYKRSGVKDAQSRIDGHIFIQKQIVTLKLFDKMFRILFRINN